MNTQPNSADIIAAAAAMGIRIVPMDSVSTGWYVYGTGAWGAYLWWGSRGFEYRSQLTFQSRWRTWKRGRRLSTVLAAIKRDVDRHQEHQRLEDIRRKLKALARQCGKDQFLMMYAYQNGYIDENGRTTEKGRAYLDDQGRAKTIGITEQTPAVLA